MIRLLIYIIIFETGTISWFFKHLLLP